MQSGYQQSQPQILTPALEGSKPVVPMTARVPEGHRGAFGGMGDPGPPGSYMYNRGFYPGGALPPIHPGYMMGGRYSVPPPQMMMGPRMRYMGPPSLMPNWGGYSMGRNYYPERFRGPAPPRQFSPQQSGPTHHQPPPPRPIIPIPIYMGPRRQNFPPIVLRDREVVIEKPKKTVKKNLKHPFPGPKPLRRFRHIAYAAAFIAFLKAKNVNNRPSSMFLFGIILKEIVAALHRIYLNPSGNIYPVLNDVIGPNCYDLSSLVHGGTLGQREESVLVQELQYVVENIIYHITEIMPSTGVLGTHRKSAVFELIRGGKRFPDGYFWKVELERLQFSEGGRTMNVGDAEGFLLLIGIFISRSLITTILMKPIDYGLSTQPLSDVAERNLRIVASTLLYLVRRIAVSRARGIMGMPEELAKYLYDDEEMAHVYSKLSRTFNYSEGLLREWGTEYIRRLRASSMQNN